MLNKKMMLANGGGENLLGISGIKVVTSAGKYRPFSTITQPDNTTSFIGYRLYCYVNNELKGTYTTKTTITNLAIDCLDNDVLDIRTENGNIPNVCFRVYSSANTGSIKKVLEPFGKTVSGDSFKQVFSNCNALTSIPEDLFINNPSAKSFTNAFSVCSSLVSIPSGLFKNNTSITSFDHTFSNCYSLISIPDDLFKYNTDVTGFVGCFRNCTALTALPVNLFRYNTKVFKFTYSFEGCSSLTTLPIDFFKYNNELLVVDQTFNKCTSLSNQSVRFGSSIVTSVYDFAYSCPTPITVYVPAGSKTYTEFSNSKNANVTVIAE